MKTGTQMQGKLEKTHSTKKIKCDCKNCFHAEHKNKYLYCKFYDLIEPKKKMCKKFYYQKHEKPLPPKLARKVLKAK